MEEIVCDLPVPGGPSTTTYLHFSLFNARSIFCCSGFTGIGLS